jgi:MerR family transcriptional regulator, light-induced transcriptional regulator
MPELDPNYNLKAVVRETQLTPETLRAWERRYGVPNPERTQGGHRLYSLRDIQMLKWLVARQKEGLSISRAVELWKNLEKEGQDPLQRGQSATVALYSGGPSLEEQRKAWVSACLEFDEQQAEAVLSHAFGIASPETVCIEVLQKGISEIGKQWYQGTISVQQEHFATSQAMRRLSALLAAAPPPTRRERILAACPPLEEHEFGLLLSAFLLRRRGWPVVYLGANVPLHRLGAAIRATRPRMAIALSQTLQAAASLREMGELLQEEGTRMVYGGGIFQIFPVLTEYISGTYIGNELAAVPQIIEREISQPAPEPAKTASAEFKQLLVQFLAKQPLIEADAAGCIREENIHPAHLRLAHEQMAQHITAALAFAEPGVLEHMLDWVNGILENNGLPESLLKCYVRAYVHALANHLGEAGKLLSEPLEQYLHR